MQTTREQQWWADQMVRVMLGGKRALDAVILQIGLLIAKTIMQDAAFYQSDREHVLFAVLLISPRFLSVDLRVVPYHKSAKQPVVLKWFE